MALSKSLLTIHCTEQLHNPNPILEMADSRLTLTDTPAKGNRGGGRRRRRGFVLSISGTLLAQVFFNDQVSSSTANALDFFRFTPESEPEPERTLQNAQEGIRKNSEDIIETKKMMIEKKLWKEAQREIRRIAGNMKQDMYIIIQAKPPKERPLLRTLYSNLFNAITKLDYAARDEDEAKVLEYYKNIDIVLDDFFSRI